MENKRKESRQKEENVVQVSVLTDADEESGKSFHGLTKDISMGGMCVVTDIPLEQDTHLKIEFSSKKTRKKIEVLGNVKWANELEEGSVYEVGVEFAEASPKKILLLLDHLYGK